MNFMDIPYTVADQALSSPCKLSSIWKVQANEAYHPHKRGGFHSPGLFITYEGRGILTQTDKEHELPAGTFFLVPASVPSAYRCRNDNWRFYFLDFDSLDMCRSLGLPVGEATATNQLAEAMHLCEQLIDMLISQPTGFMYSANSLLHEILLLFARERSAAASSRHSEINAILLYMHKNIDKPLRIEELVHRSGLSRTTFFNRFRTVTGETQNDYMLKLKLESAKASLETTSLSVKEIGSKLQFYDEFHFSKLFKRQFGVAPSTYRRLKDSGQPVPET
jgi:AraC-like DNA-binding protein